MAHLTEKAIMESFVKLLSEKSLDKLTVTDIVEDCQITRRTFYYHYALSGLLYQWLEDGMKEDPEALIHRLGVLFDGNIRRSLERSAEQTK